MNRRLLATYLNDHYAASVAAAELSRRAAGSNRGSAYGEALARLAVEIEEDRETLELIMQRLDLRTDRAKTAVAWSAEKLGRLKLNGQLTGYSPLSRLEELEILALGVHGKLLLWQALQATSEHGIPEAEFEGLIKRARSQRPAARAPTAPSRGGGTRRSENQHLTPAQKGLPPGEGGEERQVRPRLAWRGDSATPAGPRNTLRELHQTPVR